MNSTKQAALKWHIRIYDRLEKNGYPAVNSEKTVFMKRRGTDFIIHGPCVDDVMNVPTCDKLRYKFLTLYQMDFEITGGGLMETFRSNNRAKRSSFNSYIQEVLAKYKANIKKSLRPKDVPISPETSLNHEDFPDPKQKNYLSIIRPNFNSLPHGLALIKRDSAQVI
jgi:hypothetical protein